MGVPRISGICGYQVQSGAQQDPLVLSEGDQNPRIKEGGIPGDSEDLRGEEAESKGSKTTCFTAFPTSGSLTVTLHFSCGCPWRLLATAVQMPDPALCRLLPPAASPHCTLPTERAASNPGGCDLLELGQS